MYVPQWDSSRRRIQREWTPRFEALTLGRMYLCRAVYCDEKERGWVSVCVCMCVRASVFVCACVRVCVCVCVSVLALTSENGLCDVWGYILSSSHQRACPSMTLVGH